MGRIQLSTVIKLGVVSLIVGTILGLTGANPFEFWSDLWDSGVKTFKSIFGAGWNGIMTAGRYTLIGAGVVVPVWLVLTLWKRWSERRKSPPLER